MEKAKNTIVKAKIKDSQLEVVYDEIFQEENYSNTITKKCSQIVHADMRNAFDERCSRLRDARGYRYKIKRFL